MKLLTSPSTWLIILLSTHFLLCVSNDIQNGKKIRRWNESMEGLTLTGLSAGQAFLELRNLGGYKVLEFTDSPRCDINIQAPFDESIISLLVHNDNPFSYCLRFDTHGNVINAGWDK